jgi:hypothetical protein
MKLLRYGPAGQEKPGRELVGRDEDGRRCPCCLVKALHKSEERWLGKRYARRSHRN